MKTVFADTSFYVAALNPRDALHERAQAVSQSNRARVVTSEYVLLEVATFFCAASRRSVFVELLEALEDDPDCIIVPASADLWKRGTELFAERTDKDWSLTDCISFVIMQDFDITDALTNDHHFEQAGFVALLKGSR